MATQKRRDEVGLRRSRMLVGSVHLLRTVWRGRGAVGVAAALVIAVAPRAARAQDSLRGAAYQQTYVRARAAQVARRFDEAVPLWKRLVAASPRDAALWSNLGYGLRGLNRPTEAAEAFRRAIELGTRSPQYLGFDLARLWAQADEPDSAMAWLEHAWALHLEQRVELVQDSAFDAIRATPRFQRLTTGAELIPTERVAGWRHDLDWLASEAKRHHYRARTQGLPEAFTDQLRRLRGAVPTLRDEQIQVHIQGLLATLGDGHSALYQQGPRALAQLPIDLYFFSDGLFIVRAADSLLVGARVEAIGATPAADLTARLSSFVSRDNEHARLANFWLKMPDVLKELGVIPRRDSVEIALRQRDGRTQRVWLKPGPPAPPMKVLPHPDSRSPVPRYLARQQDLYWFESLEGGTVVYFQFNGVGNAAPEPLAAFSRRLGTALRDTSVRSLVIDVRHNNGGNAMLLPPLIRTLAAFVEADARRQIVVIQGRATFSAAQIFIAQVERLIGASFAGEPSGSSPNFVGEDAAVRLPYSGLLVSVSTRYHQVDGEDHRTFIPNRIPVDLSSDDYFANRDPVLDEVLHVLREGPAR